MERKTREREVEIETERKEKHIDEDTENSLREGETYSESERGQESGNKESRKAGAKRLSVLPSSQGSPRALACASHSAH